MLHTLRTKKSFTTEVLFNHVVNLLTPVEVADKVGRVGRSSEFKPFDLAENLKPFHSIDFSISSLRSVGALNTLKSTFMSNTSSMVIADHFDNLTLELNVSQS